MSVDRWLTALRMRLSSLVRSRAAERDLDDEIRFHLEQAAAELVASGVPRDEALRRARLAMGGVTQRKEECREARGLLSVRAIARDAALALRLVRRQPAFSAAIIVTLAVGLGAAVSVVNVANWLLLRQLPGVTRTSELFAIRLEGDTGTGRGQMTLNDVDHLSQRPDVVAGATGLSDIPTTVTVAIFGGDAQRSSVDFVMANYFDVLGATVDGRGFTIDEERVPAASRVAIVSERLAETVGDASLVGQTVLINGESTLVVGIARRGFRGSRRAAPVDLWMPLAQQWLPLPAAAEPPETIGPRRPAMWGLIGRRSDKPPVEVLQQQIAAVQQTIMASLPPRNRNYEGRNLRVHETLEHFPREHDVLVRWLRTLVIAGVLLLVLACANVSNAMVARSTARTGELATRLALGAARLSVARTLFFESLVLSLMAGALACVLAVVVAGQLEGISLMATLPPLERPQMDWLVLGCSLAACIVVAVGAGLWPMWSVRHANAAAALQASSRSVSRGPRRLTHGLMVVQVAISVVLLIGAALFVRSTSAKLGLDVGLERQRVETFRLDPRFIDDEAAYAFRLNLIERLNVMPGVRRATMTFLPPFYSGNEARLRFHADGAPDEAANDTVMLNAVHPGFFTTMELPLVAGRDFVDADLRLPADSSPVILAETVARRVFGTADVVGRSVVTSTGARRPIVGVVRDSRQRVLTSDDTMDVAFQPFRLDYTTPFMTGIVSLDAPDIDIWPDVRGALAALDPSLVMFEVKSVDEGIRSSIGQDILTMRVATALGCVALFLAAVGLASVLARGLAERRREIGIRTALGATPRRLAALIGRQAIGILVVGATIGTVVSVWLTRFVESRLYGISRLDPTSFVVALILVAAVVVCVSLPMCRRAVRVPPAAVLKEQ